MNFSRTVNTNIILLYIITLIIYAILRAETTSLVGLINWALLLSLVFLSLNQTKSKYIIVTIFSTISYFILHKLFGGQTELLTSGMYIANISLFVSLPNLNFNVKPIAYFLLGLMVLNIFVGFNEVIQSPHAVRVDDYFSGLFNNSNTNGNFACCALAAVFLFIKKKKIRRFTLFIFIIYLLACKSRNALLFSIIACGMNYLLLSKWKNKAIYLYSAFFIFCFVYLILIEPLLAGNGPEIFGKEASSAGRSLQILITIKNFPLTFWGLGDTVPGDYVISETGYAIHNMYVNTIYAMGIMYVAIYVRFIFDTYKRLKSILAKSFLLAFLVYFLFEPGMAFSPLMINSLPLLIILFKLSEEKHENNTLHPVI